MKQSVPLADSSQSSAFNKITVVSVHPDTAEKGVYENNVASLNNYTQGYDESGITNFVGIGLYFEKVD